MTRGVRGAVAAAALGGGAIAAHLLPESGPTICPFALGSGVACPLCGLTRAALSLLRGDVAGALSLHPLLVPLIGVALAVWLRPGAKWAEPTMTKAAALTAAFVVVWGVRFATGTLPPI